MAQQTAVEWLQSEWQKKDIDISIRDLWKQAKAMEKEQMHKCASFWRGKENKIEKPMFDLYYKETFNK
jgi:hypothetical protein